MTSSKENCKNKIFEIPEIEVSEFEVVDVIATSSDSTGNGENSAGDDEL